MREWAYLKRPSMIWAFIVGIVVFGFCLWALDTVTEGPVARVVLRFFAIWLPELNSFKSTKTGLRLFRSEIRGRLTKWMIYLAMAVILLVPINVFIQSFLPASLRWLLIAELLLYFPLCYAFAIGTNRHEIRAAFRRQLSREGTRLCVCGYNLRDNESGRCPECGAST